MFTDEVMFELMLCPPSPSDSENEGDSRHNESYRYLEQSYRFICVLTSFWMLLTQNSTT